jgi:enoyl-CoA hydratase/carnithine racemase
MRRAEQVVVHLLVRAEGPSFGTGGAVAEWPSKSLRWFQTFIDEVNQAYRALEALRIPTIAAVRGYAIGGYFKFALHCDLLVTADTAAFHAIEIQTGMVPLAGGLQRLA